MPKLQQSTAQKLIKLSFSLFASFSQLSKNSLVEEKDSSLSKAQLRLQKLTIPEQNLNIVKTIYEVD